MIATRPAAADDRVVLLTWSRAFLENLISASRDPWFEGAVVAPEVGKTLIDEALAEQRIIVAELDQVPAGYCLTRVERPFITESPVREIGHISQVYVIPTARRRGVAGALVAAAEAGFRAAGLTWSQLSYQPANSAAAASWTALGFSPFRVFARKRLD